MKNSNYKMIKPTQKISITELCHFNQLMGNIKVLYHSLLLYLIILKIISKKICNTKIYHQSIILYKCKVPITLYKCKCITKTTHQISRNSFKNKCIIKINLKDTILYKCITKIYRQDLILNIFTQLKIVHLIKQLCKM